MVNLNDFFGAFFDASKWGLANLYPWAEAALREALASGGDFDSGWGSCRKESRSVRFRRKNGKITVDVTAHMDDIWEEPDLIFDALWEIGRGDVELPDDVIDTIRELAAENGIDDSTTVTVTLPGDASFDDVMRVTGEAEDEAEANNRRMFDSLCWIVRDFAE